MATLAAPSLLDRLGEPGRHGRVMVVVAHPEDETIGAGALLARVAHPMVVHLTDGVPPSPSQPNATADAERAAYVTHRRQEVLAALALVNVHEWQTRALGRVDQQLVHSMAWAARELAALLLWEAPDLVVTHAFEGGHPDHDAAAFICRAAVGLCELADGPIPEMLAEMPFYHDEHGANVIARFLQPGDGEHVIVLGPAEQDLKKRQLAVFRHQEHVVAAFPTDVERFRPAPRHDFASPPHPGVLHYEEEPWGVSWPLFRQRATEAARELDLEGQLCR